MQNYAKRYQILRGVASTGRKACSAQPTEKPLMVAYLLNEDLFVKSGGLIAHHRTLFLDDPGHDWDWRNGIFFYYGHAFGPEDVGDIVAIFETERR